MVNASQILHVYNSLINKICKIIHYDDKKFFPINISGNCFCGEGDLTGFRYSEGERLRSFHLSSFEENIRAFRIHANV